MRPAMAVVLLLAPAALHAQDDAALRHAHELLADRPIIDGHNDLPWEIRTNPISQMDVAKYPLRTAATGQTDLTRLRTAVVGADIWSVNITGAMAD